MKNRKLTGIIAGVMLAAMVMTGCSGKGLDGSATVATVGDETISLGVANFLAKVQQSQMETYYKSYFGDSMWSMDIGGMTYEESVKNSVMDTLKEYYIVRDHAADYGVTLSDEDEQKIADTAAAFMADNSALTIKQMTASADVVKELLELATIRTRVYNAVIAEADTNVSDEEAAQKKAEYFYISVADYTNDDGETVSYTDEEKAEKKQQAQDILDQAKESGNFEEAITAQDLTMSTTTFGGDATTALPDAVKEAADALAEGEYTDVIEANNSYYVAHLISEFDQEATDSRKAEIVSKRQTEHYDETYENWSVDVNFSVNEKVWKKVTFDAPLTITTNQTVDLSTEQTTDGSDEAEAADETTAGDESTDSTDAEAADTTDGAAAENADTGADAENAAETGADAGAADSAAAADETAADNADNAEAE